MAGDGWTNPVIGGADNLIRRAMQSPNFVTGVSGWTVRKDGTVEFNVGVFRGTVILTPTGAPALLIYDGAPAAGHLILAISPIAGTDSFGNHFEQGLTLANYPGITADQNIHFDVNDVALAEIFFNTFGNTLTLVAAAVLLESGSNHLAVNANGVVITGNGLQIGNGFMGGVTSRDSTYSKSIPNNVGTVITALSTVLQTTDFGGEWSAGTFTAPINGFYDASHYSNNPGGVTDFRNTIRLNAVNIGEDQTNSGVADASCAYTGIGMTAGQTLDAVVLQVNGTAVAKTVTGRFSVCRRLA